jgi:hypothetical protein
VFLTSVRRLMGLPLTWRLLITQLRTSRCTAAPLGDYPVFAHSRYL